MTRVAWLQAGVLGGLGFVGLVMIYGVIRGLRSRRAAVPGRPKGNRVALTHKQRGSGGPPSIPQRPTPAGTRTSGDDPLERAEYEREMEHLERTRSIQPSRSIEPGPRGQNGERREE